MVPVQPDDKNDIKLLLANWLTRPTFKVVTLQNQIASVYDKARTRGLSSCSASSYAYTPPNPLRVLTARAELQRRAMLVLLVRSAGHIRWCSGLEAAAALSEWHGRTLRHIASSVTGGVVIVHCDLGC
jgi:hypothetical protein